MAAKSVFQLLQIVRGNAEKKSRLYVRLWPFLVPFCNPCPEAVNIDDIIMVMQEIESRLW